MSDAPEAPGATPARVPRGAPTKFSPAVGARVTKSLLGGNYLETAAASAGITAKTVRRWRREGLRAQKALAALGDVDEPSGVAGVIANLGRVVAESSLSPSQWAALPEHRRLRWMARFATALAAAEADAEARNVAFVQKAASENTAAAQWWLERRFPARWVRPRAQARAAGESAELEKAQLELAVLRKKAGVAPPLPDLREKLPAEQALALLALYSDEELARARAELLAKVRRTRTG